MSGTVELVFDEVINHDDAYLISGSDREVYVCLSVYLFVSVRMYVQYNTVSSFCSHLLIAVFMHEKISQVTRFDLT